MELELKFLVPKPYDENSGAELEKFDLELALFTESWYKTDEGKNYLYTAMPYDKVGRGKLDEFLSKYKYLGHNLI